MAALGEELFQLLDCHLSVEGGELGFGGVRVERGRGRGRGLARGRGLVALGGGTCAKIKFQASQAIDMMLSL
jgi:hypothetical protein